MSKSQRMPMFHFLMLFTGGPSNALSVLSTSTRSTICSPISVLGIQMKRLFWNILVCTCPCQPKWEAAIEIKNPKIRSHTVQSAWSCSVNRRDLSLMIVQVFLPFGFDHLVLFRLGHLNIFRFVQVLKSGTEA